MAYDFKGLLTSLEEPSNIKRRAIYKTKYPKRYQEKFGKNPESISSHEEQIYNLLTRAKERLKKKKFLVPLTFSNRRDCA